MSKKNESESQPSEEAFEIIEMATQDIQVLVRAFNLVAEICDGLGEPQGKMTPVEIPERLIN